MFSYFRSPDTAGSTVGVPLQLSQACNPELNGSPMTMPVRTRSTSPAHRPPIANPNHDDVTSITSVWSTLRRHHGQPAMVCERAEVSDVDGSATVPARTKLKYLAVYFALNLGLTLLNKAIMLQVCLDAHSLGCPAALWPWCHSFAVCFCSATQPISSTYAQLLGTAWTCSTCWLRKRMEHSDAWL